MGTLKGDDEHFGEVLTTKLVDGVNGIGVKVKESLFTSPYLAETEDIAQAAVTISEVILDALGIALVDLVHIGGVVPHGGVGDGGIVKLREESTSDTDGEG